MKRQLTLTNYFSGTGSSSSGSSQDQTHDSPPKQSKKINETLDQQLSDDSVSTCGSGSDSDSDNEKSQTTNTRATCDCECCAINQSTPYQPDFDVNCTRRYQGSQNRAFNKKWYCEHQWISFCERRRRVFCYYCRRYAQSSPRSDVAFVQLGFNNWKKAKSKFREHEKSRGHRDALLKYRHLQEPSVASLLSSEIARDQKLHRDVFIKLITSLQFLLRQGLAIRGHDEDEGNLSQLLLFRSQDVPELKVGLLDRRYRSPEIINELIQLIGHQVLRLLLADIYESDYFSIIADETRDMGGREQMAICIRWVDHQYSIHEDLIGLVQVDQTDGATLASTIKDCLIRVKLGLDKCVGQAYDGASNMSGQYRGVASRIQTEYPRALYVHCMAHCLNLCLQDSASGSKCVNEALSLASDLANFVRASPKRLALFEKLQGELKQDGHSLKPLCPTRWTVRTAALQAILENWNVISAELDMIRSECTGEPSRKACGLLAMMDKFSVYFGFRMSHLVFSAAEQVSKSLQTKHFNAQEAYLSVCQLQSFLNRQRSDSAFNEFFSRTRDQAKDLTEAPVLPRKRYIPKRVDEGGPSHQFTSVEDYYRKQYYEVIDLIHGELDKRFNTPSFELLREIENLLLKSCNGVKVETLFPLSDSFTTLYSDQLDMSMLQIQLAMLPDLLKTINDQQNLGIKSVSTVSTISDLLNANSFSKTFLSQVDRLLKIYLTMPMNTATAERSFSCLRRLKNYLRSTMSQQRLNHVILAHTHKERTDLVDPLHIAKLFISVNDRRRNYFGKI